MLLEISFYRTQDLDEKEVEAHVSADTGTMLNISSAHSTPTANNAKNAASALTLGWDDLGGVCDQVVVENPTAPFPHDKTYSAFFEGDMTHHLHGHEHQEKMSMQKHRETPVEQEVCLLKWENATKTANNSFNQTYYSIKKLTMLYTAKDYAFVEMT